jgi:hypothetical protein
MAGVNLHSCLSLVPEFQWEVRKKYGVLGKKVSIRTQD